MLIICSPTCFITLPSQPNSIKCVSTHLKSLHHHISHLLYGTLVKKQTLWFNGQPVCSLEEHWLSTASLAPVTAWCTPEGNPARWNLEAKKALRGFVIVILFTEYKTVILALKRRSFFDHLSFTQICCSLCVFIHAIWTLLPMSVRLCVCVII